ncbi:U-box domain-containing protein 33-like isoform X1 [Sorghum bicolor]|uniref:U-box domain-containing protein 33-like isoform X1 n=1 Tax=Sorghum bicolor TaxID=4558 RepID=UPI000B424447|nr:U-box domain-containing protein 33-like isoform X1 [Sorghum bicolor]XP_021306605.1 U-box domain-containing protein 33-like isoform X1 [Sorghum bicolor]|eukprot:XP_021306604.1 U-box domain-containing protein 33-like isoform X1 [Sorghum bicolor]
MEGMSMIYIAVGKDYKSDKRKLLFVLQQFPGPIGILHVHSPSKLIPILGARVPEKFAREDVKEQHMRREKEKMLKLLRSYVMLCSEREVKVQYITNEDTLLALQQLVLMNQVRKLVMASRSMSKENALLQFCQILLVRNGRHEWTSSPATPQWTPEHLTGESEAATAPWGQRV